MKNTRIFVARDHSNGILPDSDNNLVTDNPVGMASFLLAGACGLAAAYWALFFTKIARPHHAHRNSHTYRAGHPLRQTRLGAPSPTLKPTAGIETNGVHSGQPYALCTYGVHLQQVRKNEPFRLRAPLPGAFGLLLSGTQIGGEKHGHSLRACRKRAGRLRGLIH